MDSFDSLPSAGLRYDKGGVVDGLWIDSQEFEFYHDLSMLMVQWASQSEVALFRYHL